MLHTVVEKLRKLSFFLKLATNCFYNKVSGDPTRLLVKKDANKKKYMKVKGVSIFSPFPIHSIYIGEDLQNFTKNILIMTVVRDSSIGTPDH